LDSGHDVRIACLADPDDPAVADADIGLDDASDRVDDRCVLDDDVENSVRRFEVAVDALAIAQILACADQKLVSVDRMVVLDLGEELRIAEPDKVPLVGP
jgi:hypothetical protein